MRTSLREIDSESQMELRRLAANASERANQPDLVVSVCVCVCVVGTCKQRTSKRESELYTIRRPPERTRENERTNERTNASYTETTIDGDCVCIYDICSHCILSGAPMSKQTYKSISCSQWKFIGENCNIYTRDIFIFCKPLYRDPSNFVKKDVMLNWAQETW